MPNPIYLLHLSDWHISQLNIDKFNSKIDHDKTKSGSIANFDDLTDQLAATVKNFLERRKRSHIDIVAITGDMTDKNGDLHASDHDLTLLTLSKVLDGIRHDDHTKVYTVPGNHDISFLKSDEFLNGNEEAKTCVFKSPKQGNHNVIDKNHSELSEYFQKYCAFSKAINATNASDPLNGFDLIEINENQKMFVNWFNTSWLCRNNWHGYCSDVADTDIGKRDEGHISVGKEVNKDIFSAMDALDDTVFKLSLSHHYPRLLNWHDIYSVNDNDELSFYEKTAQNDLVLNGHTHGKLFDFPFSTTGGLLAFESAYLERIVSVIEIDLARNYYIIHQLPFNVCDKSELHNKYNASFRVFNDSQFINNFRASYTSKDLYLDIKFNTKQGVKLRPELDTLHKNNPLFYESLAIESRCLKQKKLNYS